MIGYGTCNQPAGTWSDDSSMLLATLRSLRNGFDITDMMERFCQWMVHGRYTPYGEAFDVGRGTRMSIIRYLKDKDVMTCGGTSGWDNGNGSLMRILPVALYCSEKARNYEITYDQAYEMIHLASGLTHNHLRSKMACGIYFMLCNTLSVSAGNLYGDIESALAHAFGYYGKSKENHEEMANYHRLRDLSGFASLPEERIKSSGYVVDTLEAAIWCLLTTSSYEECVLKAVNLGEDTDTVASVAGGLAGLFYGVDQIPEQWKEQIPRREWIEGLCAKMEG